MSYGYGWGYAPYVSVAGRKARAAKQAASLRKKGRTLEPVTIEGRTVARSFWGKAWCRNLERYGDFSNRLPRGRSYLANGLVLDLKVAPGLVTALVQGSDLYEIEISVDKLAEAKWAAIRSECAGKVDSLVELLDGRLSQAVMSVVTRPGTGLFPSPAEIRLRCSCPDSARLCKHLAAALYGIGARLDHRPELLFLLRQADHLELVTAAVDAPIAGPASRDEALAGADLSSIFGIDLEEAAGEAKAPARARKPRAAAVPRETPKAPTALPAAPKPKRGKPATARPAKAPKATKVAKELTTADLVALGVSRATIRNWLAERVLEPTDRRGVYARTGETARRIKAYLSRRKSP
jgi:uncharacterized Zn finger protein